MYNILYYTYTTNVYYVYILSCNIMELYMEITYNIFYCNVFNCIDNLSTMNYKYQYVLLN